jgi:hypothetical protein
MVLGNRLYDKLSLDINSLTSIKQKFCIKKQCVWLLAVVRLWQNLLFYATVKTSDLGSFTPTFKCTL